MQTQPSLIKCAVASINFKVLVNAETVDSIEMKWVTCLCCVCAMVGMSGANYSEDKKNGDTFQDNINFQVVHSSTEIRDLGTGGAKTMKKPKLDSNKDKLSKNDSKGIRDKKIVNGNGKGKGNGGDDENINKGKGMTKKKGMMDKVKGKSIAPISVESISPSTTETPITITSSPAAPIPTASPKPTTPVGSETTSPIVTPIPSPVALDTEAPSVTAVPIATTDVPIDFEPSAQPILVSPTNFAFVGISNILVRYESLNSTVGVNLNQTMAAIDLTCEYLRDEAIIPLGALEFACIWFLPEFDENELAMFPLDITFAGTAAFTSNAVNVTSELLDSAVIAALTVPLVGNLTELFKTELPSENPFSQTEDIYAVV